MKKKVLFISDSDSLHKNNHLLDSFKLREDLILKSIHAYPNGQTETLKKKFFEKIKIPIDLNKVNKSIIENIYQFNPKIVFIVKGNTIFPNTLRKIKKIDNQIKLISWSLDDMYAFHNRSLFYTLGLKYYDEVFTTKSFNVNELKKIGAKKVHFIFQAFSKSKHICNNLNVTATKDVSFIGFPESSRFNSISNLANNGIKIELAGGGGKWNKKKYLGNKNIIIHGKDYFEKDYSNFISSSKINLCFLRKINRDLHTSRSLEIPACGGFMLAERTIEHEKLFKDKKEAVFFDNDNDLLEKVKYYLKNDLERERIKASGYKRCISSNYSYDDMLEEILSKIV